MAQPNYTILSFNNITALSGQNVTSYYYKDSKIYIDGSENIPEAKELILTAEQQNRITRVLSMTDSTSAGTFTTIDGIDIPYAANNEIYLSHNYVNNDDVNRDINTLHDSWWYDTKLHRSYRVYSVLGYTTAFNISGEMYYDWRVLDTYIVYKDATANTSDGIYTFSTIPPRDLQLTASVKLETPRGLATWDTAELNIYKNETLFTSSLVSNPGNGVDRINLYTDVIATSLTLNDTFKMSLEVDGNILIIEDPLLVPEYTMSFVVAAPPEQPSFLGFTTPDDLQNFPECQPTLNNATVSRQSLFLQDVDYSTGINTPQNITLIVGDVATKADTPDSNYSQYSHTLLRYYGVKTTRTQMNTGSVAVADPFLPADSSPYTFTTDNLGAVPNVETLNYYTGYFNRIVDPYPLLNNKTAYFVKYLVDPNSDVLDPSLSEKGFDNLKSTYKLMDVGGVATKAKASIISQTEADELKNLEELKPVYRVGSFPTPILYSQNSSNAFANPIQITNGASDINVSAPYWSLTGANELTLLPAALNTNYDNDFFMKDLSYTPGPNADFPLSVEPSYTKFPTVTDKFKFEIGDEIRFENNESLSYRIQDIQVGTNVVISLDRDVVATNLDFFVVRRFKDINNYVILNQQKSYSIPPSASSAPGILATQYQVSKLDQSPDDVISNLIEKGLI